MNKSIILLSALALLCVLVSPAAAARKCPSYTTKATCVANPNCMWIERVARCSMKRG